LSATRSREKPPRGTKLSFRGKTLLRGKPLEKKKKRVSILRERTHFNEDPLKQGVRETFDRRKNLTWN